jgi:hypothetical protein
VVARLADAGHWGDGDPDIIAVFDSGYDLTRLAWLLRDLPVEILGRLRSDRVMYSPPTARQEAASGRPARHGPPFRLDGQEAWPAPAVTTVTETTRYGTATAMAWGRLHQRLARQRQWKDHPGPLPVIEGTLIRPGAWGGSPGSGRGAPGRCSLASRPGYCRNRPPARIPRSARSATPLLAGRGMRAPRARATVEP